MHIRDTLDLKAVSPLDVLGRYRGRFSAACTDPMRVGIRGLIPGVGESMKRMAICLLAVLSWSEARASGPLEIVFYDVHGTDQRELRESMDSHGPVGVDGERHHGYTRWHVGWAFELVSSPSWCRVRSVETTLKVTMTLPRWNRPDEVPEDLEREWRRYSDALREHEEGHHEIAMSAADEVRRQLTGVSSTSGCQVLAEDLDRRAKAVIETFNARELEYDAATDHGSTQGARF